MPARTAPEPETAGTPETPEDPETPEASEPPVQLSRRERRAKHTGASALPVQGPPVGRRYPVQARPRDYASRRRG